MKNKKKLIALSLFGIADTIYLSLPFLTEKIQTSCSINAKNSCEAVTTSIYSKTFFGIPNAFLGFFFFLSLFLIFIFWNKIPKKELIRKMIFSALIFALLFYAYLIYIQKFILQEYCLYCLFSAIITFLIFIFFKKK